MKTNMIKVLFLSQGYPNRYDLMSGLFVQKHAEAVSLYCDVKVLYVHADEKINKFEFEEKNHINFRELIIYYPCKKDKVLYKAYKTINYIRAYIKGYKLITKNNFQPDIVHTNILTRTGFIAYLLKCCKGFPYVVTEHWSRYLPGRNAYKGILRKLITRLVVKNAEAILPVSEILKNAMLDHKLANSNYVIVNNVVDNYFFEEIPLSYRTKKRILHISCFDEQAKNVKGIIRATNELSKKRQDFELILIGTGVDYQSVHELAETFDFPRYLVHFFGEKTPKEVAYWLKNSDFLVMFSNYETAGVVIAESLACGKPVISTNVGIAPEYINKSTGMLVNTCDELALTDKMNYLLDHFTEYNADAMRTIAQNCFSYQAIGQKFYDEYIRILKSTSKNEK